jgi:hypothetical protein
VTQEVTTGNVDWNKVGIDAAAGAIGGEVSLYAGPVVGGMAAGFADSVGNQLYEHHGFNDFNWGEVLFDTALGGLFGKFGDYLFNEVGATNPATWGEWGYRAALGCVKFGGGDLTSGGLNAAFSAPLALGLTTAIGIGSDRPHHGLFGE